MLTHPRAEQPSLRALPPREWRGLKDLETTLCHVHSLISAIQPLPHVLTYEVPWTTREPDRDNYNQNHRSSHGGF